MQPNIPNNPYPNAGVPNYGGIPYPYPQMPPQAVQPIPPAAPAATATLSDAAKAGTTPPPPPRRAEMKPGTAIPPVAPGETAKTAHKKTVLPDGTVLPDVIYVKKKGATFGFIAATILLIACAVYAVITTLQYNSTKTVADEMTTKVEEKDKIIDTVVTSLGLSSYLDLTSENLRKITTTPEGAVDIDLSTFGDPNGSSIRTIRISPNMRYALAEVGYYGAINYYYRDINNGGWNFAFSRNNKLNCREVSKTAMKVITELGGIDKNSSDEGQLYDCIDPKDGDKLYDFADAIDAGVYGGN